jgi:hypothetical protein
MDLAYRHAQSQQILEDIDRIAALHTRVGLLRYSINAFQHYGSINDFYDIVFNSDESILARSNLLVRRGRLKQKPLTLFCSKVDRVIKVDNDLYLFVVASYDELQLCILKVSALTYDFTSKSYVYIPYNSGMAINAIKCSKTFSREEFKELFLKYNDIIIKDI